MNKYFKKIITIMLLSILIINQSSMQIISFAAAPTDNNWGNQFITNVKFTDRDGNEISSVPEGKDFKVRYEFEIPSENEDDMKVGQYMLVELPRELQTIQNDSLAFKDRNGAVVANGQATVRGDSEYKVVFTDYVENHSKITGFFEFYVKFANGLEPDKEIPIEFPTGDGPVVVPITPEGPDGPPGSGESGAESSKYTKSGYYLGNGEIQWVVKVGGPRFKGDPQGLGYYEPFIDLEIFDEYGSGQELISDSVEVHQAVAWTGGFYIFDKLADAPIENHDSAARTFEVSLGDTIDGYGRQISYMTKITDPDQEEFVNKASATARDVSEDMVQKIRVEGGTAGAGGTTAGFTVIKQDADGKPLEGASFDLYRMIANGGETKIATGLTSGKDGIISYDKLRFGTYELREKNAPEGYKLLDTPYRFVLNAGGMAVLEIPIINELEETPVGSVELIKYDEADESKGLAGAEFDLFRGTQGSGTLVSNHVTPASGTIQVNNLEFGDYYFVETKAPAGYELDATPRTLAIGENQVTVPFKLAVSNKAIAEPAIQTVAFETGTESKILLPGGAATISDRVSYSNLIPGKEYRLDATLLTKNSALELTTGQKKFTAATATGQEVVNLAAFNATALRGQQVVVFEQLTDVESGLIVATHEDLNDADQTVSFADPRGDVAFTKVDADTQTPLAEAEFTLYEGTSSAPGKALGVYTSAPTTGKVTVSDLQYGNYHFVETKAPNGGYILDGKPIDFEIASDAAVLELDNVTNTRDYQPQIQTLAFETGSNNKELYPGMATLISDRVTYEQLTPGKNYRLEAKLMTKDGQTTLTQGSKTFAATTEDGEEVVALDEFDARALKGQQVVVFERLIDIATNKVIATHEDLNDADQTVAFQVPSLQTFAFETSTGLQHDIHPHQNVELSDRVVYTNLNPGERYTLEATLVDKLTGNIVFTQGTHEFIPTEASGEVTVPLNNLDTTGLKGNSYVVFEVLKDESGQVIAEHADKDSLTQTVSFIEPSIGTVARDKETGESNVHAGPITIVDEVQYQNLDTTQTYDIEGILMDKATNQPLLVDGQTVTATKSFSPANVDGTEEIEFTVDASQLKGKDIVVFETLKLNGVVVAVHQDINDAKQTIKVVDPAIGTTLRDEETATQTPSPEEYVTLVDLVKYENLIPGHEYTVKGILMDKTTEAPLVIDGEQVEAETTFTPETANGEVDVTFTFGAKGMAGQEVVAFEYLYQNGKEMAVHTDINDANQTVAFKTPEIGTTATNQNGEKEINADKATTIIDTVDYKDLIAGKEYTLQGILMDKATNAPILVNGEEVYGETIFTPENTDGSVEVAFTFDASDLYGRDIVVFEKLMRNGKEVVNHEDINDEGQTIFIKNPDIGTTLRDVETGTQSPSPEEEISLVDTVRYENLTPGREYTVTGILMDKTTGEPLVIDGEQVEAETTFTPTTANGEVDVTFTFGAKGMAGQEVVAFEYLYQNGKEMAVHTDIHDANQTVAFKTPEIGTTATNQNGEKEINADKATTIIDTVGYKDLIAGKEYTLQGILMDKATNAPILVKGEEVYGETIFTPENPDGSVEVAFTFDASDLYGKDIVVFEKLMRNGKEVVNHEDINDEGQTIFIKNPDIGTTLRDLETGTQSPSPEEEISLVDTVRYEKLTPGREYTVKGILMDKATEAPLLVDGEQVEAETTFTPETANGEVDVTFTFGAKGLAGQEVVAFERLYADNKEVAVHTDINDANQTVHFKTPEIGTTATDQNGEKELNADNQVTIIDVVDYKDLIVGKEYTVQGMLMDKATNAPILVNGEEVHGETTFTPEDADGSVEVAFTFDASDLYGKDLVVFEKLMRNGKEVVNHEDINDEGQTVTIKTPEIGTTLRDVETGTQSPSPEEEISLVDTVRYENLTPGREYTVQGILMDKSTEAPLLVDGEQVEAETTFTPETANGEVDVTFTLNAKALAGQEVVAFEHLYTDHKEVAVHTDINDENQTVQFTKPDLKTIATDQKGDKEIMPEEKVSIIDKVYYEDLIVGKEYTVTGKLMDKATGKPVVSNGKEVLGETTFTPEEPSGVVEVAFDLDARELAGSEVVVFEKLFRNGKEVVVHEDINDLDQTVRFIKKPDPGQPENIDQLEDPQNPLKPENLSKAGNGVSELEKVDQINKSEERTILTEKMPKTGDTFSLLTLLFGSLLIVIGFSMFLYKRKQPF